MPDPDPLPPIDPEPDPDPPVEADEPVPPFEDERTGEDLGEVSGGGEVTDLGGDSPSS